MAEAFITPKIISWALKRSHINSDEFAHKLNIPPDKLNGWITGNLYPSLNQARDLAKKLKIPFGYLYFDSPPVEEVPLPDFRNVKDLRSKALSPDFLETIYDCQLKQEWYRDYLTNEGAKNLTFIGRFKSEDMVDVIAEDMRNTLGINVYQRPETESFEEFLRYLIQKAEQSRILILRSGIVKNNVYRKLNTSEFLGFAISDKIAPLVFINENDYKAAQIFTLIHEIAHLWINKSGISNPNYRLRQQNNIIEKLCDNIAAEVLVPKIDFLLRWDTEKLVENNIEQLAIQYRVSAFVILRRAYTLDIISKEIFKSKYDDLLKNIKPKSGKSDGGNFYNIITSRNSKTFTHTLINAVESGKASPVEAAHLLNVRIGTFNNIENYLSLRIN